MRYVCDAPDGKVWFRLETQAEAARESDAMNHAVDKHFQQAVEKASTSYKPVSQVSFEQNIGLADHITRVMPVFLTLRDGEGTALATAMLPPSGEPDGAFRPILMSSTPPRLLLWRGTSGSRLSASVAILTDAPDRQARNLKDGPRRAGTIELPLPSGHVPRSLANYMACLGAVYGTDTPPA
jgi:hypothetical protein